MELTTVVCPVCGAPLPGEGGKRVCRYCKSVHIVGDPQLEHDFAQANVFRESTRFREAEGLYQNIIKDYPDRDHADVYWNLLLCQQRVMFETDEKGERFPSFYAVAEEDIETSSYYISAIGLAERNDPEKAARFRDMGDRLIQAKRLYHTIEKTSAPYDIFICFKKSAFDGGVTKDHDLAYDLYNHFAGQYRVFFSEKSLKDVVVREYEPNIYYGLYTAKVMLVLCSKRDYLESQWVKNEWSRFHAFTKNSATNKTIIPIFIDEFKPSMLPEELAGYQGLTADVHLIAELERTLERIVHPMDLSEEIKRIIQEESDGKQKKKKRRLQLKPRHILAISAAVVVIAAVIGIASLVDKIGGSILNGGSTNSDKSIYADDGGAMENPIPEADGNQSSGVPEYTCSASGEGVSIDSCHNVSGAVVIPDTIEGKTVVKIGDNAFSREKGITSVTIPSSVTTIGLYAFSGCNQLTTVTLPQNLTSIGTEAFGDCTSLTSIAIPSGVTEIGDSVFSGCTALKTVTLPSDLISIGASAFSQCGKLETISIPASVTSIGSRAFYACEKLGSVTIPAGVTTINESTFYGCAALKSVTIGEGVVTIGESAFADCTGLTEIYYNAAAANHLRESNYIFSKSGQSGIGITVNIGANVTRIPNYLFSPYSSADSAPKIVTVSFAADSQCATIGNYAFSYCDDLTAITLPSSLTNLGDGAFQACTALEAIVIPSGVTVIGAYTFDCCEGLTSLTLHEQITNIGEGAFFNCIGLSSVTIPSGVTRIGSDAFGQCMGLTAIYFNATEMSNATANSSIFGYAGYNGDGVTVYIGENVTRIPAYLFYGSEVKITKLQFQGTAQCIGIGDYAFADCQNLLEAEIPASVTSIGQCAFRGCSKMSVIFANTQGWMRTQSASAVDGESVSLSGTGSDAVLLFDTYDDYYWKRN